MRYPTIMATVTRSSNSPSISLTSPLDPSLFPLKSINDVVNFFKRSLELYHSHCVEPDLTLLSIVAGYIELSLTTGDAAQAAQATINSTTTSSSASGASTLAGIVGNTSTGVYESYFANCVKNIRLHKNI